MKSDRYAGRGDSSEQFANDRWDKEAQPVAVCFPADGPAGQRGRADASSGWT